MYYVMSDVHGCYDEFVAALAHWNPQKETLVVLGDLVDRGPDSYKVVQTLCDLKDLHGDKVIVVKGNHDESFANWAGAVALEDLGFYYKESHEETVKSFFMSAADGAKRFKKSSRRQRGEHLRYKHKRELHFLLDLPLYFETEHCVFVHAGVNLDMEDWRVDRRCMNRVREDFYDSKRVAPKRVFFGHTPTALMRDSNDSSVWFSEHGDKVGLDGGVSFGGQLNVLRVSETGDVLETLVFPAFSSVQKPLPKFKAR